MKSNFKNVLTLLLVCFSLISLAQEANTRNWDNIMYVSNKIGWGSNENWRNTAEFQTRFKGDFGELEQWHVEYAATHLKSEHWEFTPDFRFTKKPDHTEYRPGFGAIYKNLYEKSQLVHQVKYQWDKESTGYSSHGLRYGLFYNYAFSEKLLGSALIGGLFEFGKEYNGFLGMRTGVSAAYVMDKAHSINVGYFYGLVDRGDHSYTHMGVLSFQLIINIRKDYKYLPAKYIQL